MRNKLTSISLHNILALLLLLGLPLGFMFPGLFGPFLLDDLQTISPTNIPQWDWHTFWRISLENETGPIGRPIAIMSFILNHLWLGSDAFDFKIINIFLHLFNGLLILKLFGLLARYPQFPTSRWFAYFITLFWLIHPLQVSTALYPVQRMVLLSTLFTLLGIICYLKYREDIKSNSRKIWLLVCYGVCLPLAILSKETGILLPFYILALEGVGLKYYGLLAHEKYHLRHGHLGFCLLIIIGALLYYWLKLDFFLATFAEKGYNIHERLLTQLHALIFYLKQSVMPKLGQMGLFHDDFRIIRQFNPITLLYGLVLLSLFCTIFILRRTNPLVSLGLAWFFVAHMIESTVLPLEMVFEHRQYFALIGILMAVAGIFIQVKPYLSSQLLQKIMYSFWGVLLIGFGLLCFLRSVSWSSSERFLHHAYVHHPQSARVHIEMANWLLESRSYFFALQELERAEAIQPNNMGISLHKLLIYCHSNQAPKALYTEIQQKSFKSELNPYSLLVLDAMVNNLLQQQCQGVDAKEIKQIIHQLYEHPYIRYKPLYHAMLLHLEAGLSLLEGNHRDSRGLLLQSYEKYPKRYQSLQEKVKLENALGLTSEAEQSKQRLQEEHPFAAKSITGEL